MSARSLVREAQRALHNGDVETAAALARHSRRSRAMDLDLEIVTAPGACSECRTPLDVGDLADLKMPLFPRCAACTFAAVRGDRG
jgi:hypothetical protein